MIQKKALSIVSLELLIYIRKENFSVPWKQDKGEAERKKLTRTMLLR